MFTDNFKEMNAAIALLDQSNTGVKVISATANNRNFTIALDVPALSSLKGAAFSREFVESIGATRRLILSMQ